MKDMNRVKVTVIGVIAALAVNFMGVDKVQAQEFKIQGDLVSSYVWRGFYQTGVSSVSYTHLTLPTILLV